VPDRDHLDWRTLSAERITAAQDAMNSL